MYRSHTLCIRQWIQTQWYLMILYINVVAICDFVAQIFCTSPRLGLIWRCSSLQPMTPVVAAAALSLASFRPSAKPLVCRRRPCPPKGGRAGRRPRALSPAAARSGTPDRLARVAATPLRRTPEVPQTTCVPTWTSIDEYVVGVGTKRSRKSLLASSSGEDDHSSCSGA